MKCGLLLTYPLTPFPIKVNLEDDNCVNHITNKNIDSKERCDIIFSILNLMATQRSMNTAVWGILWAIWSKHRTSWFHLRNLEITSPNSFMRYLGRLEGSHTWVEDMKSRSYNSHFVYLKCHEGLPFDILSSKIWSLACGKGSCKHSRSFHSPGLSVLNNTLTLLSSQVFRKLCLPGKAC